jgi:hypothetical protein
MERTAQLSRSQASPAHAAAASHVSGEKIMANVLLRNHGLQRWREGSPNELPG